MSSRRIEVGIDDDRARLLRHGAPSTQEVVDAAYGPPESRIGVVPR